jgi:hypothetical protein
MSAGWITVHFVDAPASPVLVFIDRVQAIGAGVDGGCRIILTSSEHYDVCDDLAVVEAQLTAAGR